MLTTKAESEQAAYLMFLLFSFQYTIFVVYLIQT